MTPLEVIVIFLGAALIGGQLWLFLGPRPPLNVSIGRAQEVQVVIKGGFSPDTIMVEAGRPVRLLFYRDETAHISERVVFDSLKISEHLPAFETTAVEFLPADIGDYAFRCGSAAHGLVAALVGGDGARANLGRGHQKHA